MGDGLRTGFEDQTNSGDARKEVVILWFNTELVPPGFPEWVSQALVSLHCS